ncbi:probable BOI-related E3 ubiquitin-protein ligase 3 [Hibiscus syriacus]|uniref:probable BOI-related E3 ubiquitin-protein ligase 3 n=1 Tax=Hibiscus syriacus TaxID=106335 RepID=UPI001924AB72|nr:probable BOI-related E3 ubiquitin-protein ligase 3 [Hibiscus syriacus]XP_039006705.1 probable BOI-related E3 ubiquitin-protein ligase 3 [Hibiscus syriacus]
MAVQAQLYADNIGFPFCGSLDLIENGCGIGAGAGFNQYGLSVHQLSHLQQLQHQQQQFQYLQNQKQRNQNLESMMFSQNMVSQVEKQRHEIDQFIKSQNERLRLLLQEQRKQQLAVLAKKIETRACVLLNQKDEEIVKATNKAMELQNLLGRLEMESQAWQRVAQENEAMVLSLNNRLEQLREQASCRFNNSVDDAESCCECEPEENNNTVFQAYRRKEHDEEERTMVCKCCYRRDSFVLFLPCRHLCSCKDCAVFLDSCPVCKTAKKGSIEALVS